MCSLMSNDILSTAFKFIFTLISIVIGFIVVYVFPLVARFENSIKNTLMNAVLMSIKHLPYTLIMLVLTLMPLGAFVLFWEILGTNSIFRYLYKFWSYSLYKFYVIK